MNQRPLRPERAGDESQVEKLTQLAESLAQTCTNACTRNPEPGLTDLLESLAKALRDCITPDECRQLAEL
ncbi:MAG: hypothetical protein VB912_14740, partial [Pirellulaceae bacterium]